MQYSEYACSSITVSRELPACVDREVETRDAHISSSMLKVHYHSRRCPSAFGIAGGREPSHRVCPI
ncbi:hypothetical protein Gotur_032448 [Gossypium turneri]